VGFTKFSKKEKEVSSEILGLANVVALMLKNPDPETPPGS
jgi:hypothetical protein